MDDLRESQARLFKLFDPAVERAGHELVAVEFTGDGGRRVLRVSVDRPGGVDIDDLARLSYALSVLLDVEDPIAGAYHLEVSSPGIDRPLQRASDFLRFVGYRARIRLTADHERRRYSGVLRAFEDGVVRIEVDGQEHQLPFADITQARLVLDLDEYQALADNPPPRVEAEGELS